MAAAAVRANLAGTQLVPRLRGVQHHPALIDGLEGERCVRGDFRQETCVRLAVRIAQLAADEVGCIRTELSHGDLAQDTKSLVGVIIKAGSETGAALAIRGRFHRENAYRVDVAVLVKTHV